jgi:hypothetical protein
VTQDSPLLLLRPLTPAELLLVENRMLLKFLSESLDDNPLSAGIEDLLEDIYAEKSIVWTWGTGILLTSFETFRVGRVLHVSNVRGRGYLSRLPSIEHDIEVIAREWDCRFIKGDVPSAGLVKKYVEMGAKASSFVIREVR